VELKAGLDGCGKTRRHRVSIPPTARSLASRYTDYPLPAQHCYITRAFSQKAPYFIREEDQ